VELTHRSAFWRRIVLVVAYSALILYFGTSRTNLATLPKVPYSDKYLHALVFGGLGLLGYLTSRTVLPRRSPAVSAVVAVVGATLWGAWREAIQWTTTYRTAEFGDLAADAFGAVVFVVIAVRFKLERSVLRLL
jgi:VanZ family protein